MSNRKNQVIKAIELAQANGLNYEVMAWQLFRKGNGRGVVNINNFPGVDRSLLAGGEGKFWQADKQNQNRLFLFSPVRVMQSIGGSRE